MGWFVWVFESASSFVAAYLVAVAAYRERDSIDRIVVALLVSQALVLLDCHLCGMLDHFAAWPLALVGTALFAGTGALAFRAAGRATVATTLRWDLAAPSRMFREAWREREVAMLVVVPAGIAMSVVLGMVWYFKSWTWDPAWYHVPITSYVIQERSTGWIDTPNPFVQGYPRNVEILAAWNCVFQRDNRLDDSSQLPFALLGMAVVAAWSRRVGASRAFAAALGLAWFALPPVFLQAHSTHVDLTCGALFSAAVWFASESPTRRDRWMCFIAMGIYVGSKYTGLFHLALIAPWIAGRFGVEVFRQRARWRYVMVDTLCSLAAVPALGASQYVSNALHTGNPMFPFNTRIPLLHREWRGPMNVSDLFSGAVRGSSPSFFGVAGDFDHMIASWADSSPFFAPDVRSGGFGPLFRWLLVPCVAAIFLDVVRLRERTKVLPVLALFVLALCVPGAWWPRYTIGAATAGLVALALVHGSMPSRFSRFVLSCALVVLTHDGYRQARAGFIAFPRHFERSRNASPELRSALQIDTFLWPTEAGLLRERELRAGDVVAYDESVHFLAELWTRDYRTRVMFVSSETATERYVQRLRELRARWVCVRAGSPAELAVRAAGGQFLFAAPSSDAALYRMPLEAAGVQRRDR